jgi:hypothetical protein
MDTFDENIPDYGSIYRTRRKGGVMNNLHLAYHHYFHGSGGGYDLNKDTDNQTSTEKAKNQAEETLEGGEDLEEMEREFLQTPAKEEKSPAKTPVKSSVKDNDVKRKIRMTSMKKEPYKTPASQPHNSRKHMLSPEPVLQEPIEKDEPQDPKKSKIGPGKNKGVRKTSVAQPKMTKEEHWKRFERENNVTLTFKKNGSPNMAYASKAVKELIAKYKLTFK